MQPGCQCNFFIFNLRSEISQPAILGKLCGKFTHFPYAKPNHFRVLSHNNFQPPNIIYGLQISRESDDLHASPVNVRLLHRREVINTLQKPPENIVQIFFFVSFPN